MIASLSYALAQGLVGPALPRLQEELDTDTVGASQVLTVFLLSSTVAAPLFGRLADTYGRRRIFGATLLIMTLGSLVSAFATSLETMLAGRVAQGCGAALLPAAYGVCRELMPSRRLAMGVGLLTASLPFGASAGMVLSGPLLELGSSSALFLVPAALNLLALTGVALLHGDHERHPEQIGWGRAALLTAWLTAFLLMVQFLPGERGAPLLLLLAVVSFTGVVSWTLLELRARTPFIDVRAMTVRGAWNIHAATLSFGLPAFAIGVVFPFLLQAPVADEYGFGATVAQTGLWLLPLSGALLLGSLSSSTVQRLVGTARTTTLGCVSMAAGFGGLMAWHDQLWQFIVMCTMVGAGNGLAYAAIASQLVAITPAHRTSSALGANATVRSIGGALGTQAVVSVAAASAGDVANITEDGYRLALTIMLGSCMMAALLALRSSERPESASEQMTPGAPKLAA